MSALDPLLPVAVVGTARRDLDVDTLPESIRGTGATTEEVLLSAAARAAVIDKISVPDLPTRATAEPPAETEAAPAGPEFLSALLHARATSPAIVAEALRLLAARGRRLPVGALYPVLELAVSRQELRSLLADVIGQRGRWLTALNPRWRFTELTVPNPHDDKDWHFGTPAQRVAWLSSVRRVDPERGRRLLAEAFRVEDARVRADLMRALWTGLDPEDEAFLEEVLTDRGGEVRMTARSMLAAMPESAYVARMRERIATDIAPARGRRWQVDLSGPFGPPDVRDGVEVRSGERPPGASAIRAMVGGVPLAVWADDFGYPATELATIHTGIVALGPLPGLRDAAIRERDAEVAAAVLRAGWPEADPELVACLTDQQRNPILASRIRSLGPVETVPELAVAEFGSATAQAAVEWLGDSRSFGQRGPVLTVLGTHGPRQGDWDLASELRRLAGTYQAADRNRAFQAAMTINLRRSLAAALADPAPTATTDTSATSAGPVQN